MIAASFLFSVMGVLVKTLEERLPASHAIFARSLVGLLVSAWLVRRAGLRFRGQRPLLLAVRGTLGFAALFCTFTALARLPLADHAVITMTQPVWTACLAALFLRERAGARVWGASGLALAGVVLVARPSFIFGEGVALDALGVCLALAAAVFSGAAYVTVRALRGSDHPWVVVFWFALVATPAGLPGVIADPVLPTGLEVVGLIGVGLAVQGAQMLLTRALHREPAGRVSAVGYLQVVFAFAFGAIVFRDRVDALAIAGAALVVVGAVLATSAARAPAEAAEAP
jgi:drug/metabolite transporter (DMT)-like permease